MKISGSFINDPALLDGMFGYGARNVFFTFIFLWCQDQEIDRVLHTIEHPVQLHHYLSSFALEIGNDKQIHITFFVRGAGGLGSEKNDFGERKLRTQGIPDQFQFDFRNGGGHMQPCSHISRDHAQDQEMGFNSATYIDTLSCMRHAH